MKRRRARVAVVGAAVAAGAVVVAAAVRFPRIVEDWHIRRLEAGIRANADRGEEDPESHAQCREHLAALVEMKSLRAIRHLSRFVNLSTYENTYGGDVLYTLVEAAWPESLDVLVEMLEAPNPRTRAWSAALIADEEREVRPELRLPALVAALRNPDDGVRFAAARFLNGLGVQAAPVISSLEDAARDPRVTVRLFALSALSRIDAHDRGVGAAVAEGLADPRSEVRYDVVLFLNELELHPTQRHDLVPKAAGDWDEDVRAEAVYCLSPRWDQEHDVERDLLFRLLDDRSLSVRANVAQLLSLPSSQHAPRAFQELKKLSPRARERLAFLFVQHPPAFTPLCLEALRDPAPDIRAWAAAMLFQIGPRGTAELPVLLEVLRDEHGEARMWAVENLGTRKGGAAVPGLVEALKDPLRQIRSRAAHVLGGLDLVAGDVVPALEAALRDPDPATRVSAAATLLKVAPESEAALAVLRWGLNEDGFVIRCYTLREIRRAGPSARRLRPEVVPLAEDPADEVRHVAREALERM